MQYWDKDTPDTVIEIDLTALKKTEILIGNGIKNDVVIPDNTIESTHIKITAEKVEETVRFTLVPLSRIRKGYREYETPIPLEENVSYQMGNKVMRYIGDLIL